MRGDFSQKLLLYERQEPYRNQLRKEKTPCIMLELICIKRHLGFILLIHEVKNMMVKTSKTNQEECKGSPIRIKAFLGIIPHLHEGMLVRLIPSPLASICPRKSLVPCCVQLVITNLWLYGQPFVARSIGGL